MPLTQKDLKKHIWLCAASAISRQTLALEHDGFNYFFQDAQGRPMAYKLVMLR